MALPNIFKKEVSAELIERINSLQPHSTPNWGKMDIGQMLAHCNVMFEMVYDDKHPAPNPIVKLMMKGFVKKIVIGEKSYKKNGQTAAAFIIKGNRNFDLEKARLIAYIDKTQELGEASFDKKSSLSFGVLTKTEWSNLFYKHLDHHLTQFGA